MNGQKSKRATAAAGTVYLVGAGPGDPELLTLRAARLLASADVVLHDDLVSEAVLDLAGEQATVTSVGKRCGQARIAQPEIHSLMIEAARAGKSVLRLKSGDPLIFGRAWEEMDALQNAGIPFEIVPGVTAALAAGALLGLPLTSRTHASKLIFTTGHHAAGREDTPLWQGELPPDATLAIYMPGRDLGRLQAELTAAGLAGTTACAAISQVATVCQKVTSARLAELHALETGPAPLLLLVGEAIEDLLARQTVSRMREEERCKTARVLAEIV